MERGTFHGERVRRRMKAVVVFLVLSLALFLFVFLNILIGNVSISPEEVFRVLFRQEGDAVSVNIVLMLRLPRLLLTFLLGGALALSGFLLQTFFENPIAGPFVLGISSGAKMVVALVMILLLDRLQMVSSWMLVLAAFLGALIVTGFILLIARRVHHQATLLVAGIMIGYICSAVSELLITFAEDSDIVNLHGWSLGSFSGSSWEEVRASAVIVGVTFFLILLLAKPMSAYQLGEQHARSVGVNIRFFRVLLILLSSVLSACVTAFAGPISFVGIAVPILLRKAFHTSAPLLLIPGCFLGGAVFCMGSDLLARTLLSPLELNISTVTAVFGAPVVIVALLKRHREGR